MEFNRESGILLHPTSLPSKYGIGDLGKEAYDFIDFLRNSNQKLWQILPLNPVGYGESPYQSFSAFAGNPLLISIDFLIFEGLISKKDVGTIPKFNEKIVEYHRVKRFKNRILRKAYKNFNKLNQTTEYLEFVHENRHWLEDYCFFMALKNYFRETAWNRWERSIALRKKEAMEYYKQFLQDEINYHKFLQYKFYTQWLDLRRYANKNGIKIIGDLPIFISYDSSDAWAYPNLFELDDEGNPAKVAGVPPDYFSKTGQLWGNPHFKWEEMEKDNFRWWIQRFVSLLKLVDIIRVDHFRGFEAYWEIPGGASTAEHGKWVKAPGEKLFATVKKQLGELPIIAEDLGFITEEVRKLKHQFGFPGMIILQFACGHGAQERFRPEHHEKNSVVYTGTHDNDTIIGWYKSLQNSEPWALECVKKYFGIDQDDIPEYVCWHLIEIAFQSNAVMAIIPLQDILSLDSDARMNYPGTIGGNWQWRFCEGDLTIEIEQKLLGLTHKYNR